MPEQLLSGAGFLVAPQVDVPPPLTRSGEFTAPALERAFLLERWPLTYRPQVVVAVTIAFLQVGYAAYYLDKVARVEFTGTAAAFVVVSVCVFVLVAALLALLIPANASVTRAQTEAATHNAQRNASPGLPAASAQAPFDGPSELNKRDHFLLAYVTQGWNSAHLCALLGLEAVMLSIAETAVCYDDVLTNEFGVCRGYAAGVVGANPVLSLMMAMSVLTTLLATKERHVLATLVVTYLLVVADIVTAVAVLAKHVFPFFLTVLGVLVALSFVLLAYLSRDVLRDRRRRFWLLIELERRHAEREASLKSALRMQRELEAARRAEVRATTARTVQDSLMAYIGHQLHNPLHALGELVGGLEGRPDLPP
jgi:hypothetical protein